MRRLALAAVVATLALAGCEDPTGIVTNDDVVEREAEAALCKEAAGHVERGERGPHGIWPSMHRECLRTGGDLPDPP